MEEYKISKWRRLRIELEKKNKNAIVVWTSFAAGVAATLWVLKPAYDPNMPIPGFRLSEDAIKRDVVTGIMVAEFLKERKLVKDVTEFGIAWFDPINAAGKDKDMLLEVLKDYPKLDLLSRLKLER